MPFIIDYFYWHYTSAPMEAFHIWRNLVWFIVELFSITQLTKAFFSPWKRMTEEGHKAWDIEGWASDMIVNLISRLLGATLRSTFIIIGIVSLIILMVGIVVFYIFWMLSPAIVVLSFSYGFFLIF
ncbi:hypothetical protein KC723_00820 [Candidatus Kaiserbacteria bacterium]|nr:hypothetical protein [Candidatus Kaiserbacteria bacterium]